MPDSMSGYLDREMECEGLLECFHGLKPLDRRVFRALAAADGPQTVDEVAAAVDRERTTAYRSVQRLRGAGIVRQEQVNYDEGGYYYVFEPAGADDVADDMQRMLNDTYAQLGQLIDQFRTKYAERDDADDGERATAEP
jgi:predicted transcriptional regulator